MFHREGHTIIFIFLFAVIGDILLLEYILDDGFIKITLQTISIVILLLILQFFRNPVRNTIINEKHIISPVDGKIVNIEKVFENEYFKEDRIQISIFMSPINVHVTRYPMSGKVIYSKYHPGKYLVAWHPKSSEKNERTTIVLENKNFGEILYRQIAGAIARRIVNYAVIDQNVTQGKDAGFIKFGSRVDLFLPVGSNLNVELGQHVRGGEDVISVI
ncbi:MAG: phosphatidylserine decarboxylase family protein [Flavobacteriales bacterium]|nr:phosphatidylserine decarboxylase family protein [Flavobacteriales bacterium]